MRRNVHPVERIAENREELDSAQAVCRANDRRGVNVVGKAQEKLAAYEGNVQTAFNGQLNGGANQR